MAETKNFRKLWSLALEEYDDLKRLDWGTHFVLLTCRLLSGL